MNPQDAFSVIKPKPLYRDGHGRFRRENTIEFKGRHNHMARALHLTKVHILNEVAKSNPYIQLLMAGKL